MFFKKKKARADAAQPFMDELIFKFLYFKSADVIRSVCLDFLKSHEVSDEIITELFIAVWENRYDFSNLDDAYVFIRHQSKVLIAKRFAAMLLDAATEKPIKEVTALLEELKLRTEMMDKKDRPGRDFEFFT